MNWTRHSVDDLLDVMIPMLGMSTTLASIDTYAVAAAAVCVGVSLLLAWTVMHVQRRHDHRSTPERSPVVGLPLVGHPA